MSYKRLYLWIEGPTDPPFFEFILPLLKKKYQLVDLIKFAEASDEYKSNFMNSIKSMEIADYIVIADINASPCVSHKKDFVAEHIDRIDKGRIMVVIKEIESWYLAGIDDEGAKLLGIKPLENTNDLTKEIFNRLVPKKYQSRIDFMMEILKHFSVETAKQKNKSFKYFWEKYLAP